MRNACRLLTISLVAVLGCANAPKQVPFENPQIAFWESLESLCGKSFEGRLLENEPPDESFEGKRFVMHVRKCSANEIRIPFFIGENRSRTWVFTRTKMGLRLKHDHRHEDGSEDDVTQYGGDTHGSGNAWQQEFYADAYTAELLPAASTNVWTVQVEPGRVFSYTLRREGTDRRFKVEFDLGKPIATPPAPWGAE